VRRHPAAGLRSRPQTAAGAAGGLWFPLAGDSAGTEPRRHPWERLRAPRPLSRHRSRSREDTVRSLPRARRGPGSEGLSWDPRGEPPAGAEGPRAPHFSAPKQPGFYFPPSPRQHSARSVRRRFFIPATFGASEPKPLLASAARPELAAERLGRGGAPAALLPDSPTPRKRKMKCRKEDKNGSVTGALRRWGCSGTGGRRAGWFGMDAAGDAGCPSNGCYGKHLAGEISSRSPVSVRHRLRERPRCPAPQRAGHRRVGGVCLRRDQLCLAFPAGS